jgi:RNA polymerase sigma-70 factor, ECF subfamily
MKVSESISMTSADKPELSILPSGAGKMDRDAFGRLVQQYRSEIKLHGYRMMGSIQEAEDLVQETFLRAWRGLDGLEGRGSVRGWLYSIATNTALNMLAARANARRLLPHLKAPPSTRLPEGQPASEIDWLEPYPDFDIEGIADGAAGPDARYEMRESVQLAFVAAIQQLPARQRAVLLLCDVMGWSAKEAADLLGGSVASVNSAIQRARDTLAKRYPDGQPLTRPAPNERQRELLDRYLRAWEHGDLNGFIDLLRNDATYSMPPWSQWYSGREAIRAFFAHVWNSYGSFRLIPTGANRQPAFAVYSRGKTEAIFRAHSIQLLELEDDGVASLTKFVAPLGPGLFVHFRLPPRLPG